LPLKGVQNRAAISHALHSIVFLKTSLAQIMVCNMKLVLFVLGALAMVVQAYPANPMVTPITFGYVLTLLDCWLKQLVLLVPTSGLNMLQQVL
jgi:hypothetical protein